MPDKVIKNHRKTLGLLRDLQGAKTFGIISSNEKTGITEIARPIGVIEAVVPSTNPVATPTNNIVNALKTGNAIVLSPSPRGVGVCEKLVGYIHAELKRLNENPDLVQFVPAPSSKDRTQRLMEICDLVVVTGSQDNVRRGYSAGTPSIGVGAGNVSTIVDEAADLLQQPIKSVSPKPSTTRLHAARKTGSLWLMRCGMTSHGRSMLKVAVFCKGKDAQTLHEKLFENGKLNRHMIARDLPQIAAVAGLEVDADARFLMIESTGIGAGHPELGEKLSSSQRSISLATSPMPNGSLRRSWIIWAQGTLWGCIPTSGIARWSWGRPCQRAGSFSTRRTAFATGGSFDNGMPFSPVDGLWFMGWKQH